MRFFISSILALACALPLAVSAGQGRQASLAEIRTQQIEIRERVQNGDDQFANLSRRERNELVQSQDRLLALFAGKNELEELDDRQKDELVEVLGSIGTLVAKANESKKLCHWEATLGSNRKQRVCVDAAEARERALKGQTNTMWGLCDGNVDGGICAIEQKPYDGG